MKEERCGSSKSKPGHSESSIESNVMFQSRTHGWNSRQIGQRIGTRRLAASLVTAMLALETVCYG